MANLVEIRVPDLGGYKGVDVLEVLVKPGSMVKVDDALATLSSDKASMDLPSTAAGTVREVRIQAGGKVNEGDVVVVVESAESVLQTTASPSSPASSPHPPEPPLPLGEGEQALPTADLQCDVLVLGAGPGGYTAAYRAADLDQKVVLVERFPILGGVCLNVGCIPSKALLHVAKVIDEAAALSEHGVAFGPPKIDLEPLRAWKDGVVSRLTGGLAQMAKQRKVQVVTGTGTFEGPHLLRATRADGSSTTIAFRSAIIAVGSRIAQIPGIPYDDARVLDSTSALELRDVPEQLLVVGGGIIGLEMATFYRALGSAVTVVELLDGLMPGADRDLVRVLERRIGRQYEAIYTSTKVLRIESTQDGLKAYFEGKKAPESALFDRVLVAVGRRPNGDRIGAEMAGVSVDSRGFIAVDGAMRTNVRHIFAIGDVIGQPMLAHKAMHEAKVAAEVAAGHQSSFDARVIPSVAYTDPEIAWAGLTETEAKTRGVAFEKGAFPWSASGRALALGQAEGWTKLLFDPSTKRILGAGIVGPQAGELIAEAALAIEMGAEAGDLALTIHPHPTLSETVGLAAEAFEGSITDLYLPRRK
ncbi:MAG: dihydrolipoyl dehydrogenase [Acidobacteriota bacterium]